MNISIHKIWTTKILIGLSLFFNSCEKDTMGYEGVEGIYFAVQHGPSYGGEWNWAFQPFTNLELIKHADSEVTMRIKVMVTGPTKDYDRPFKVEINPDSTTAELGVHYKALPTDLFIPAFSNVAYIPVTILRAPDLQIAQKRIGLRLLPTEQLGLSFPEWDALPQFTTSVGPVVKEFDASLHQINISDFMVKPAVWPGSVNANNADAGLWGNFSEKKINLMCELLDITYADFTSTQTMPSVLQNLIAQECARHLIAQYNSGTPVLENDGRLMMIGIVPWTSYIGVPWK